MTKITAGLLPVAIILIGSVVSMKTAAADTAEGKPEKMIGLYVHQHWPYNHPYAARTWTYEDWCGYADGLHKLGYNTVLIWVVLETMPEPLTESDRAVLAKMSKVIDMLKQQYGMRVYLALCPNIVANSAVAGQATYEQRHFFHCDLRVNPADEQAVERMIRWREELLRPLKNVDGITLIDSDPGGYPGSTNEEFIGLFAAHRKMLDRLRPGIEIIYWMHAGWPAYSRLYQTGEFRWGSEKEFLEALTLLKQLDPEPWGLANGLEHAKKLGLESRVINYRYGAVEAEPSFPLSNFNDGYAYNAAGQPGPRGVMGNAQTHCVQLPNTFEFARGALGQSLTEADFVQFANDLIVGRGPIIVEGWKALSGSDPERMWAMADTLEELAGQELVEGPLKGLLFGDPRRFLIDLVVQLRFKTAYENFCAASEKGLEVREPFARFVQATQAWQERHGYQNGWGGWDRLREALSKLGSPRINSMWGGKPHAKTPFGIVKESYYVNETYGPRLIEAMEKTLQEMR